MRSTTFSRLFIPLTLSLATLAACVPGQSEEPASSAGAGGTQSGSGSGGRASSGSGGSGGSSVGASGGSGAIPGGTGGSSSPGQPGTGGNTPGTGGRSGAGGAPGSGGAPGGQDAGSTPDAAAVPPNGKKFSFFVTSIEAIRKLSKSQNGFGGNLGGLAGADKICQDTAAEAGAGHKTWRAFLSTTKGGPDGGPVHAIDRVGEGPWYDFLERLIARNKTDLVMVRPAGDAQATSDLPNERGEAQRRFGDNHDTITGSNRMGMLLSTDPATTCQDWTCNTPTCGRGIMGGHSWSRVGRQQWIQEHTVPGCAPGVNLRDNIVTPGNCIGCSGGYGGFYCFALQP